MRFSAEDDLFYGKIEGMDDLVAFEGDSVKELKKSFADAVEDYTELCERKNKNLEKSYKGSFNIRLPQELHKIAALKVKTRGVSLNRFIWQAVEREVNGQ